jgi:AraC-like DNA-binding protein
VHNPLLEALPECVVVPADSHPDRDWLKHLLELLHSESKAAAPAAESVIERLADILFIHVLRSYLTRAPERKGVLAAYTDSALRAALEAIHEEPPRPLTIADLASAANLSRSAFFDRFTRILGMPPMVYLTEQRLESAYRQLGEGMAKVLEIALACGYESEASFSKAFKRRYGISPGTLRRAKN